MVAHWIRQAIVSSAALRNTGHPLRRATHLDSDAVFENSLCRLDGDLVIRGVSVLHSQVVVLDVEVEEGRDELWAGAQARSATADGERQVWR